MHIASATLQRAAGVTAASAGTSNVSSASSMLRSINTPLGVELVGASSHTRRCVGVEAAPCLSRELAAGRKSHGRRSSHADIRGAPCRSRRMRVAPQRPVAVRAVLAWPALAGVTHHPKLPMPWLTRTLRRSLHQPATQGFVVHGHASRRAAGASLSRGQVASSSSLRGASFRWVGITW